MNAKKMFTNEVNKIQNVKLKRAAKAMIKDAPEYFWTIPASSSGKYHPACDLGEGGLVRHSIMVSVVAEDLIDSEIFCKDTLSIRDAVRVATLFHDVIKSGPVNEDGTYSNNTVFEHPNYGAEFIKQHLVNAKVDDLTIDIIYNGVRSHMGKWNTSKYSKTVLDKPLSSFEKLIHTADYIASRKYIAGLEAWN